MESEVEQARLDPVPDPGEPADLVRADLDAGRPLVVADTYDPEAGLGYAYVTSRMGTSLTGDPRDVALRTALASVEA